MYGNDEFEGAGAYSGTQVGGGYLTSPARNNAMNTPSMTQKRAEQSLMPLTVKQILCAPLPAPDTALIIDGKELSQVFCDLFFFNDIFFPPISQKSEFLNIFLFFIFENPKTKGKVIQKQTNKIKGDISRASARSYSSINPHNFRV